MKRSMTMMMLLSGALLLAACHGKSAVKEQPTSGTTVPSSETTGPANGSGTTMSPLPGGAAGSVSALAEAANNAPIETRTIYFDFDKSDIQPQYDDIIAAHAKTLTANPTLKIKLEGNTDERGTREYNIGLGERRAQAVRRALMLHGVADSQITTVSYGSERPAVEGDTEAAWSKNRRVDLVYQP